MTLAVSSRGEVVPVATKPRRMIDSWMPNVKVSGSNLDSVMAEFTRQMTASWEAHVEEIRRGGANAAPTSRIEKLKALIARGATEGERDAARRAMLRLARRYGLVVDEAPSQ